MNYITYWWWVKRCKHTPGMTRPARPLRWRALARDTQTVSSDSMFLFESNLSDSKTQVGTYNGHSKSKERLDLPHNVVSPLCPWTSHVWRNMRVTTVEEFITMMRLLYHLRFFICLHVVYYVISVLDVNGKKITAWLIIATLKGVTILRTPPSIRYIISPFLNPRKDLPIAI